LNIGFEFRNLERNSPDRKENLEGKGEGGD
jgi:hypothetical protein